MHSLYHEFNIFSWTSKLEVHYMYIDDYQSYLNLK